MRENSTTSTSIFVKWDDVPSENQNGIIRSYTVRYRSVSVEGLFTTTTVFTKEANLTGLIKGESYNVSVLATTVKGDGPYSVPKEFTTNEDRKYILLGNDHSMFFFFQLLFGVTVKSGILGIQLKDSGIPLTIRIPNQWPRIQNLTLSY